MNYKDLRQCIEEGLGISTSQGIITLREKEDSQMYEILNALYQGRIDKPKSAGDIPKNKYCVYILTYNGNAIVVGHGKKNRAKVIFDDETTITNRHIKALCVRIHHIFGDTSDSFRQYLISCASKEEAKRVEGNLHVIIRGNEIVYPDGAIETLLKGLNPKDTVHLLFRIALCSAFDGLADIRRWNAEGIIDDRTYQIMADRLKLSLLRKKWTK